MNIEEWISYLNDCLRVWHKPDIADHAEWSKLVCYLDELRKRREADKLESDTEVMTKEQKYLQEVAWNCVHALVAWQDCFDPDHDTHKMIGTCIKTFEHVIKEWEYAIGHPSTISNETVAEIADRMTPIIVEIIKRRGKDGVL